MPDCFGSLAEATEKALGAATHLSSKDDGAVQALRVLARKIDTDDDVREAYLSYQLDHDVDPGKLKALQMDNVSLPTYLKFAESLGLTPLGRSKLAEVPEEKKKPGTLAALQGGAQRGRRAG